MRPFQLGDSDQVEEMAGTQEVADGMLEMPHPYPAGAARSWIADHPEQFEKGVSIRFAIVKSDVLIGSVGLNIDRKHKRGELNYWIGPDFHGNGYATEASKAMIDFAFRTTDLNRIHAQHLSWNEASARVLAKVGMTHEGRQRQHVVRWEDPEDWELWGLLKTDWTSP